MFLLHLMDIFNLLNGLFYRHTQIVQINGLSGKVKCSVVHRLTNVAHITVSTYHDNFQGRVAHLIHLGQQCQAIHFWHVDIRQDNLNIWVLHHHGQRLQTVMGKHKLVLSLTYLSSKILCQQQFEIHLVVDTQNLNWHIYLRYYVIRL